MEMVEPLLTSAELAASLKVPIETLYVWRAQGTAPPGIRIGRHTRYRRRDVEAWLDQRAAEGNRRQRVA